MLARLEICRIAAIVSGITFGLIFGGSVGSSTHSDQRFSALVDELDLTYVLALIWGVGPLESIL